VNLPSGLIGSKEDILNSYNESKTFIPFTIITTESNKEGYRYKFIPDFNNFCFARLHPENVAVNLISRSEGHIKKIAYLSESIGESIRDPELTEDQLICLSWASLWCASLWYQLPEEQFFRLEQLLEVIGILKEKHYLFTKDLFLFIIQSCMNYGPPEMVIKVYTAMKSLDIKVDGRICSIYFEAILNARKGKGLMKHTASIKDIITAIPTASNAKKEPTKLDMESVRYKEMTKSFKPRTFCMSNEQFVIGDRIYILGDQIVCSSCNAEEKFDEVLKNLDKEGNVLCKKCKKTYIPHIRYQIGTRYAYCEQKVKTFVKSETMLISPKKLKEFVEALALRTTNRVKIDVATMRIHYPQIILNCIWHFKRKKLPYDLFLPYKKDIYYDRVVQSVSPITIGAVEDWEEEDKHELKMQKQYEEKFRKKIIYRHFGTQTE